MTPGDKHEWTRIVLLNVLVLTLYLLAGRFSQSLGVVTGFASPVYFPAGIALAALLIIGWGTLPAILIGAIALPFINQLLRAPGQPWTEGLFFAAALGTGPFVQAGIRAWLIRRLIPQPFVLIRPREILLFVLLTGPLGCLIASTWSSFILFRFHIVQTEGLFYAWLNWWAGDSIGSLAVVLIALCFFAAPRGHWRRRFTVIGLPVAGATILAVLVTFQLRKSERDELIASLEGRGVILKSAFESRLDQFVDTIRVLEKQIRDSEQVDSQRFRDTAEILLASTPGLRAIAWSERFSLDTVASSPVGCLEKGPHKDMLPCSPRPAYVIVRLIEPLSTNKAAIGYDLASDEKRRDALFTAARSGRPTATELLSLVQAPTNNSGFLLAVPIKHPNGEIRGFVNGVFLAQDMIAALMQPFLTDAMNVEVSVLEKGNLVKLYESGNPSVNDLDSGLTVSRDAHARSADRLNFRITLKPSLGHMAELPGASSWLTVLASLGFIGAISVFLLLLSSRNEELLREIGERLRVEGDLLNAKNAAEKANQAKSEFLANMSHEIRTPMNAVIGFSDLLVEESVTDAERRDFLQRIRSSGSHLLRLIDDILDISKVDAGHIHLDFQQLSVADLALGVFDALRTQAERKGLELELRLTTAIPATISSDAARLRQIMLNLVGNAIKFTHAGFVRVNLAFSSGPAAPSITIDFEDSGIGIPPGSQKNLFQLFGQADTSVTRKYGGSGLGLLLSQKLARALGGDLYLKQSAPETGSTFRLTIPTGNIEGVAFQSQIAGPSTNAATGHAKQDPQLAGFRVLLAEDQPDNVMLMRLLLKSEGVILDVAQDGREAVEMASRKDYDLILMDLQMPNLGGLEATRVLREKRYDKPIVAVTAHALKSEILRSIEAGCNDHITKPVNRARLIETLKRFHKLQHID